MRRRTITTISMPILLVAAGALLRNADLRARGVRVDGKVQVNGDVQLFQNRRRVKRVNGDEEDQCARL